MEYDIYYAATGSTPYYLEQIILVTHNLVFKPGIFMMNENYGGVK